MQCPKCGTEFTREDIIAEGTVQCSGCGAIYHRKKPSESVPKPAEGQRNSSQKAEPQPEITSTVSQPVKNEQSPKEIEIETNWVAGLLRFCGWIIYAGALFLGFMAQDNTSATIFRYIKGFTTISMVSIWITGFVYGTIALSIGEIIQLLHEINQKQSRR